jgi:hypothetical protein
MNSIKKSAIILIFISIFLLINNKSDAQLSFTNTDNEIVNIDSSSIVNELTKPRPGFKKRRLGIHTPFVEGGYFFGYYSGIRYSVNYDILVQSGDKNALTARIGIGINKATNDSTVKGDEFFYPFGINVLMGHINHLELGFGAYYFTDRKALNPYFSLGFRHQKPKGGFMYRIAFDIHLERVYDLQGKNISKTGVMGPLVGLGWTF